MVRPCRKKASGMNAKKSTQQAYYRSKKEGKAKKEMFRGLGAGYGNNGDELKTEGIGKRWIETNCGGC